MSRDVSITGYRPPNEQFKKMGAVYDACRAAKIPIPEEVLKYFNYESPPSHGGVSVKIESAITALPGPVVWEWTIDVSKLPQGLPYIRVTLE